MKQTLKRICELQPYYSANNTLEMQERGLLIRQELTREIRNLAEPLSNALGEFGHDFDVDASDGIGRKTELPWVRFHSKQMSPSATQGFYCVLHFSTDGSAVHIAVGCSSSKFKEGYSVVLPPEELDERTAWARQMVLESLGSLEPFSDPINFGATRPLPKSFERACAMVKTISVNALDDNELERFLVEAARALRAVYSAQRQGRELSPADQDELEFLQISRPRSIIARGQGYGLTSAERKAVELRAMDLSRKWMVENGYHVKDTSANKPYDFEAKKGAQQFFVEVKGTTSDAAEAISMTHTEVAVHQSNKGQTALCLVTGIRLDRSGISPIASQGTLEVLIGWDIDEWGLKPTAFRVERKRTN